MGDCGLVGFVWVDMEDCPWIFNASSPSVLSWQKSNLVFIDTKSKVSVQIFCTILNISPLEPIQSAMGPRWLLDLHGCYRDCVNEWSDHVLGGRETDREREREREKEREENGFSKAWD